MRIEWAGPGRTRGGLLLALFSGLAVGAGGRVGFGATLGALRERHVGHEVALVDAHGLHRLCALLLQREERARICAHAGASQADQIAATVAFR